MCHTNIDLPVTYVMRQWRVSYREDISSLYIEFLITGLRVSARPAVEDRNEVTQIKYFFHDSFTTRQIRARDPLASRFEQVNFTPRRLLTDGSRIREDFRNFLITSLQIVSRAPRCSLPIGFRFSRDRRRKIKCDKSPEFRPSSLYNPLARPFYLLAIGPWFLPVLPLSHVYGRGDRALLKRVSFEIYFIVR